MDKVLIKDIAEVVNGSTPSTKENSYWDGNIPWITPKDLSAFSGRYISSGERNITKEGYLSCSTTLVPKNTILLTSRAPIGYLAIAKNDLCTNQGFKSLICNQSKVLPLYLFYWLSTKIEFLKSISGGATFKELSKTSLENVVMDLPNIAQQRHIVDTIGSVDSLIEFNQEKISKIKSLATQKYEFLYKAYPKLVIGKKLKFVKGKQPKFVSKEDGLPYLVIDDLVSNNYTQFSSEGLACDENDVLMVMDGASSGKVFTGNKGYVGSTLAKLSSPQIKSSILYFGLSKFEEEIMKNTTGSAIPHTDKSFVSELRIIDDLDGKTTDFFDFCLNQICNLRTQNSLLNIQKEILLQKYFH